MKKFLLVLLPASLLIITACNFSSGFKKDFATDLSYKYNGFRVQNVLLLGPDNTPMTSNKVQLNTKMAIAAMGIANYGVKDGKVYPGMMLVVTDSSGTAVLNAADLFQDCQGYPPESATELRGDITIATPIVSGKTYHVKVHIWDKVKADNELNAETDLIVQ